MATATDDFNRANGSLGANWTVDEGSWSISSNQAVSGGATQNIARYTGSSFTTNHYSEIKVPNTGSDAGVGTRVAASQAYLLFVRTEPTSSWEVHRYTGGYTSIGSGSGAAAGDIFRLESTNGTHKVLRNTVQQGSDITDSNFTTGDTGLQSFNIHALDDWAGGDLGGGGGGGGAIVFNRMIG